MNQKIIPTVGRIVLYHPVRDLTHAAIITDVISEDVINVCAFNESGTPYGQIHVRLYHEGDDDKPTGSFAEWMPYQKSQSGFSTSLEDRLKKIEEEFSRFILNQQTSMR